MAGGRGSLLCDAMRDDGCWVSWVVVVVVVLLVVGCAWLWLGQTGNVARRSVWCCCCCLVLAALLELGGRGGELKGRARATKTTANSGCFGSAAPLLQALLACGSLRQSLTLLSP